MLGLLLTALAGAPDLPRDYAGSWRAVLASPGGELPFELVLGESAPCATIVNGAERVEVPEVALVDGQLELRFPHYDSAIRARLDAAQGTLAGAWEKQTSADAPLRLEFSARRDGGPRFPAGKPAAEVGGRWRARFASQSADAAADAIGLFEQQGTRVTGTFLTRTGDHRYLAGSLDGERLRLSCFDGAHAFLFDARLTEGKLAGQFWSGGGAGQAWSAERDPEARLADPWQATQADTRIPLELLVYPDLDGVPHALGEYLLDARALVLVLMGSWCPNCHDELRDLAELDRRHRARGLRIVGLAFEHKGEFARDAAQVRRARERHGLEFPLLLAGASDKRRAREAFPLLTELVAFPTTLFVRRDGTLRALHTGYAGPGTGAEHERQRAEFEARIVELLDAPDADDRPQAQHLSSGRWLDQPNGFLTTIFATRLDGKTLLKFQSDDPAFDDQPGMRRMHDLTVRGRSVRFGTDGPLYWSSPLGRALLDPFDAGHRLGAELPNNAPVPEPELPVPPAQIAQLLASPDPRQAGEALYSAARARQHGTWREPLALAPFFAQGDVLLRTQAAWCAGELHDATAVPALIELATHGFAPLRRECARALGRLRAETARAVLEQLARDFDPSVRAQAVTALARLPK